MRISDWSSDVCSSDLVGFDGGVDLPQPVDIAGDAPRELQCPVVARYEKREVGVVGTKRLVLLPEDIDVEVWRGEDDVLDLWCHAAVADRHRSEEWRVGKECVSTSRYRW